MTNETNGPARKLLEPNDPGYKEALKADLADLREVLNELVTPECKAATQRAIEAIERELIEH
jgi:hypothetical protein